MAPTLESICYYFSSPVGIEALLAKLEPFGIRAERDYPQDFTRRRINNEELQIVPHWKDETKVLYLVDTIVVDDGNNDGPTTILNAIREAVGELLDEKDLDERITSAAENNDTEQLAYLKYLQRGGTNKDVQAWIEKAYAA